MVAAGLFALASCEKNFDPQIFGTLSTTNFPATQSDYESELMVCYLPFNVAWNYRISASQHNWYVFEGSHWRLWDVPSDYCQDVNKSWGGNWRYFSLCNFEYVKTQGRGQGGDPSHYETIRDITRFTQIIQEFRDAPDNVLPKAKKEQFEAEARLCRGLCMYYLFHIYGPVPVILDPELVGNDEAEAKLVRPTLDEMTQYITDDFEYAAAHCPEKQMEVGRYTADYARFCLMKHYLNEGAHVSGYYQKAYDLYSKFTGGYKLFTDGGASGNAYAEQFKMAHKFNCEVIMAVSTGDDSAGGAAEGNFNAWSWYAYPGDCAKVDDKGNPTPMYYQGGGWSQCCNVDTAYYDTYEPGDQRRDVILTEYYSGRKGMWIRRENVGDLWSGFICDKYPQEKAAGYQATDIPLARWADVMLLYAEASVRKSNSVTAEAVDMVNQVRARAGLGALTADKTASVSAFMDALLAERGHEFLYEGFRKIDLIRFNVFYTKMSALGRTPTSQYWPVPNFSINQAAESGYELTQYFTRPDYDGPKL